jgi:predicted nucleotidyltransferase
MATLNPRLVLFGMSSRMAFLKENSEAIKAIAARHKAFNVAIFGSVARGEDGPDSDVDFLVDFLPGPLSAMCFD